EGGTLAQEPVPRVNGVAAFLRRRGDDAAGVEIGGRPSTWERAGVVSPPDVQRPRVVGREHGDRRDAQLAGRPGDADGDLATVRNQQPLRKPASLHGEARADRPRLARNLAQVGFAGTSWLTTPSTRPSTIPSMVAASPVVAQPPLACAFRKAFAN